MNKNQMISAVIVAIITFIFIATIKSVVENKKNEVYLNGFSDGEKSSRADLDHELNATRAALRSVAGERSDGLVEYWLHRTEKEFTSVERQGGFIVERTPDGRSSIDLRKKL